MCTTYLKILYQTIRYLIKTGSNIRNIDTLMSEKRKCPDFSDLYNKWKTCQQGGTALGHGVRYDDGSLANAPFCPHVAVHV